MGSYFAVLRLLYQNNHNSLLSAAKIGMHPKQSAQASRAAYSKSINSLKLHSNLLEQQFRRKINNTERLDNLRVELEDGNEHPDVQYTMQNEIRMPEPSAWDRYLQLVSQNHIRAKVERERLNLEQWCFRQIWKKLTREIEEIEDRLQRLQCQLRESYLRTSKMRTQPATYDCQDTDQKQIVQMIDSEKHYQQQIEQQIEKVTQEQLSTKKWEQSTFLKKLLKNGCYQSNGLLWVVERMWESSQGKQRHLNPSHCQIEIHGEDLPDVLDGKSKTYLLGRFNHYLQQQESTRRAAKMKLGELIRKKQTARALKIHSHQLIRNKREMQDLYREIKEAVMTSNPEQSEQVGDRPSAVSTSKSVSVSNSKSMTSQSQLLDKSPIFNSMHHSSLLECHKKRIQLPKIGKAMNLQQTLINQQKYQESNRLSQPAHPASRYSYRCDRDGRNRYQNQSSCRKKEAVISVDRLKESDWDLHAEKQQRQRVMYLYPNESGQYIRRLLFGLTSEPS